MANFFEMAELVKADFLHPASADVTNKPKDSDEDVHIDETEINSESEENEAQEETEQLVDEEEENNDN